MGQIKNIKLHIVTDIKNIMDGVIKSNPRVSFEFEIEKIIGMTNDGRYQVQWAPAWVSKFHLVGCEHLIQEFLQEQYEKEMNTGSEIQLKTLQDVSSAAEDNFPEIPLEMSQEEISASPASKSIVVKEEPSDIMGDVCATSEPYLASNDPSTDPSAKMLVEYQGAHQLPEKSFTTVFTDNSSHLTSQPQCSNILMDNNTLFLQMDSNLAHKYSSALTDSQYLHTCNICKEQFSDADELKAHSMTHKRKKFPKQNSKRPFSCQVCDYSCQKKDDLVKHSRIHTGERPYTCKYCEKSFAQKTNMTTHIRRYHIDP